MSLKDLRREVTKTYFDELLIKTGGNRSRAAILAGVDRKTFGRYIKEFGLDLNDYRK